MVLEKRIVEYAKALDDVRIEEKSGAEHEPTKRILYRGERIFLIMLEGTNPLRIELRCDRRLAKTLAERYESVMQGRLLGRNGLELICSGQLNEDEVIDLVRHAYEITGEE